MTGKGFVPGKSSNLGGRPKGVATLVQNQTKDGAELVTFYLGIFRDPRAKMAYRLEAVRPRGLR